MVAYCALHNLELARGDPLEEEDLDAAAQATDDESSSESEEEHGEEVSKGVEAGLCVF